MQLRRDRTNTIEMFDKRMVKSDYHKPLTKCKFIEGLRDY